MPDCSANSPSIIRLDVLRDAGKQSFFLMGFRVLSRFWAICVKGYDEEYVAGTDFNLLKWKFAHLNSVDFRLRSTAAGQAK